MLNKFRLIKKYIDVPDIDHTKQHVISGYNDSLRYMAIASMLDSHEILITDSVTEENLNNSRVVFDTTEMSREDQFKIVNNNIKHLVSTSNIYSGVEPIKYSDCIINTDSLTDEDTTSLVKDFYGLKDNAEALEIIHKTKGDFLAFNVLTIQKNTDIKNAVKAVVEILAAGKLPDRLFSKLEVTISHKEFMSYMLEILHEEVNSGLDNLQAIELSNVIDHFVDNYKCIKDWKSLKLVSTQFILKNVILQNTVKTSSVFNTALGKLERKNENKGFYANAVKSKSGDEEVKKSKSYMSVDKLVSLLNGKIIGVILNDQRN